MWSLVSIIPYLKLLPWPVRYFALMCLVAFLGGGSYFTYRNWCLDTAANEARIEAAKRENEARIEAAKRENEARIEAAKRENEVRIEAAKQKAADVSRKVAEHREESRRHLLDDRHEAAIEEASNGLLLRDDFVTLLWRARAYQQLSRSASANADVDRALKQLQGKPLVSPRPHPEYEAELYLLAAELTIDAGQKAQNNFGDKPAAEEAYRKALAMLVRALALKPGWARAVDLRNQVAANPLANGPRTR